MFTSQVRMLYKLSLKLNKAQHQKQLVNVHTDSSAGVLYKSDATSMLQSQNCQPIL